MRFRQGYHRRQSLHVRRSRNVRGAGQFPAFGELLEQRCVLAAVPVISEFMAANVANLQDEDHEVQDWIEVANLGDT
ncbi:MAG: hypothetical protein KDB23_06720, partial [Planctomycetales bacterium]|nr:hypothetical protein [Planctomycetales bacterium]